MTKMGPKRVHIVRVRGGALKYRAYGAAEMERDGGARGARASCRARARVRADFERVRTRACRCRRCPLLLSSRFAAAPRLL